MKGVKFNDQSGVVKDGLREKLPGTDFVILYTSQKKWESVKRGAMLGRIAFFVSLATLVIVIGQSLTMFR